VHGPPSYEKLPQVLATLIGLQSQFTFEQNPSVESLLQAIYGCPDS